MTLADDYVIELALEHGLLQRDELEMARQKIAGSSPAAPIGSGVVEFLVENGELDEEALGRMLAAEFGLSYVTLSALAIEAEVLAAVPHAFAQDHVVMPFALQEGVLHVAVADPVAVDVFDNLAAVTHCKVVPHLASSRDILRAIGRYYDSDAENLLSPPLRGDSSLSAHVFPDEVPAAMAGLENQETASDAPINQLVLAIITGAIRRRASDIHLEPLERSFRLRYRIDGILLEVEAPPRRLQLAIISRLKIMANISIAEKRVPQDGRIQLTVAGRSLDFRVSSLPTSHGESIVMRVLDPEGLKLGLPELGFLPDDQRNFERLIASPDGIVLVTGPTGSGKTTTLYACLHQLNQASRKIITVEEPVEYQISGINQVPVNTSIGMTFASALRAMLRQAPNIVMVGEIRDRETAEIAINASLTGHLVFSTLHTNDAPSAVTRLVDIGAKPFLVAAALRASMAQRLVRRVCPHCKQGYAPSMRELHALGLDLARLSGAEFAHGAGCVKCNGTGYQGRFGIFEIFLVNDEIRTMVYENAGVSRLRAQARLNGMRSMREDGVRKVLAGLTTIEEVVSVTVGDSP